MQCTEPLWDFVAAVSESLSFFNLYVRLKGAKLSREGEQTNKLQTKVKSGGGSEVRNTFLHRI